MTAQIMRLTGMPEGDLLTCSCGGSTRIDPLHNVALNRVTHNCEEETWVIPDPPATRK